MLFAVNIAFLAIPAIITESGDINAAATASIVSIILSLSGVIFGQVLSKKLDVLVDKPTTDIVRNF